MLYSIVDFNRREILFQHSILKFLYHLLTLILKVPSNGRVRIIQLEYYGSDIIIQRAI